LERGRSGRSGKRGRNGRRVNAIAWFMTYCWKMGKIVGSTPVWLPSLRLSNRKSNRIVRWKI
jgi:hypothetical protein